MTQYIVCNNKSRAQYVTTAEHGIRAIQQCMEIDYAPSMFWTVFPLPDFNEKTQQRLLNESIPV